MVKLARKIQEKIDKLTKENKDLMSKIGDMEASRAKDSFNQLIPNATDKNNIKILVAKTDDFTANAVKVGLDLLSAKLGESVIVLCSVKNDGTVFVNAKVSDNLIKKVQAGKIVGEITSALGGRGGGKPQMAQGMGKTTEGLDEIILKIKDEIMNLI